MHPDISGVISDAALHDAEHDVTEVGASDGDSATSSQDMRGRVPDYAGRDAPLTARNLSNPVGGAQYRRGRGLDSTASPPSVSAASESTQESAVSSSAAPSSRTVKKKASATQKKKFPSVLAEKHDLLFRMNRMVTRGGKQSRKMTAGDSLDELRGECERMQREIETEKSVKFQRSLMTSFATGVECLNARWNMFGLRLDGWSQSLQEDMDNYNEVFEELHAKYSTKSTMPPEIKLVMMIASSAFMFHMSKSMFSSVPGMEEAMRDDPELARRVAAAVAKKAHKEETSEEKRGVTSIFANIMGGGRAPSAPGGAVPSGAVGRPMTPPDEDSLAGVEQLFSDDDSESDAAGGSPSRSQADDASLMLDGENGLILDT